MVSMLLKTGGRGAGGGGRATWCWDTGPRPRWWWWGCRLGSSCCCYHLVHVGIVDADAVDHVQQVLGVHGEDVGGRQHSPKSNKIFRILNPQKSSKSYFLYSASTVVLLYFCASFMLLTRSLMSLDRTLWAISTWRCVLEGKAGISLSTAASSSRSSRPTWRRYQCLV